MKNNKQRLFEMMGRVNPSFKPKLNEEKAFNDAGEPLMTHQQFRDHSEPSEPEYDDNLPRQRGIGNFEGIDWRPLHTQLVINTKLLKAQKTNDGYLHAVNVGDFEGMLSPDEIRLLEGFDIIWIDKGFPMIDDDQYLNYETFYNKAKDVWDKEIPTPQIDNDNEAPYMRGREPMSEENENQDKILLNMFIASLPDNFPELVKQYANKKNIGLDGAYYLFIGAFEKRFEKNNAIKFELNDDDLDELETLMYGRFGDNAIEF